MTTYFWLSSLLFAALLPWGTTVPLRRPALIVKYLIIANLAIHLVSQGYIFDSDVSPWSSVVARQEALKGHERYEKYLDTFALTPSRLDQQGGWRWLQLISANFLHAGWLHVVMNLWIFAIYAPNLEDLLGRRRFAVFLFAAMIGTQLSILFLSQGTDAYTIPHLGFSGVVYAVIGAYLVCFPRSRIKIALIYDFRFWAAIAFLLVPMIHIFGSSSRSLAEIILLAGVVGIFLLLQPEHARFGVPAYALLGYKLFQDFMTTVQQAEHRISIWGHLGGLCVGIAGAFLMNGTRGLKQKWEDPDALPSPRRRDREEVNLAKIEKAAQTDHSAARAYLGQRIFVGDAARATEFYIKTVLPKYPDLVLDPRELHNLARMLERRGADLAALNAYDKLLSGDNPQLIDEEAYLAAAKLCHRIAPERALGALKYLRHFEENAQMMRDKFEVRRLREEILQSARERGEVTQELIEQAGDQRAQSKPLGAEKSGYGGKDQPDRRQIGRSTARMRQIESSDKWPILKEAQAQSEPQAITAPSTDRTDDAPESSKGSDDEKSWGKQRLPLRTLSTNRPATTSDPGSGQIPRSHGLKPFNPAPDVPELIKKSTRRPMFVELDTDAQLENQPLPNPLDSNIPQVLPVDDIKHNRHSANPVVLGGSEMLSEDENRITASLSSVNRSGDTETGQRGSALKVGAEFAATALGPATPSPELRTSNQRIYSTDKAPSPSPDLVIPPVIDQKKWLAIRSLEGNQLLPQDSTQLDHLLAILSQELCRAITVEELSESGGLLQVEPASDFDPDALVAKLNVAGFYAVVDALPEAFLVDPVEALTMDIGEMEIVCNTVEQGRLRLPTADVTLILESRVRLSSRENAPTREIIEMVTTGAISRRLQLHERTFSLPNSRHDGEPIGVRTFSELGKWLEKKFRSDVFVRREFETNYQQHEQELKVRCLLRA